MKDGNLVLYNNNHQPMWAAHTKNRQNTNYAILKNDGNFCVFSQTNDKLWETGVRGKPSQAPFHLQVLDDCGLAIKGADNSIIWTA
ncbi:hypothetical protein HDU92_009172 [Lobulomyces angularis]|nr:hypothetical protein HDU92_009172 [Lobulomyces angularis]